MSNKKYIHEETGLPVKFMQLRDHGLTVGYVVDPMPDRLKVLAAVSHVSDRDQFNRAVGRDVVVGRLNCKRFNKKYPHYKEFFLSGKVPENGKQWRDFEGAVLGEVVGHTVQEDGSL